MDEFLEVTDLARTMLSASAGLWLCAVCLLKDIRTHHAMMEKAPTELRDCGRICEAEGICSDCCRRTRVVSVPVGDVISE